MTIVVPGPPEEPAEEIASLDDLRRVAAVVQHHGRPRRVLVDGGGTITVGPAVHKLADVLNGATDDDASFRATFGALADEADYDEFMRRVRPDRGSRRQPTAVDVTS